MNLNHNNLDVGVAKQNLVFSFFVPEKNCFALRSRFLTQERRNDTF